MHNASVSTSRHGRRLVLVGVVALIVAAIAIFVVVEGQRSTGSARYLRQVHRDAPATAALSNDDLLRLASTACAYELPAPPTPQTGTEAVTSELAGFGASLMIDNPTAVDKIIEDAVRITCPNYAHLK